MIFMARDYFTKKFSYSSSSIVRVTFGKTSFFPKNTNTSIEEVSKKTRCAKSLSRCAKSPDFEPNLLIIITIFPKSICYFLSLFKVANFAKRELCRVTKIIIFESNSLAGASILLVSALPINIDL